MLQGKSVRSFPLLASSCNIPNTAQGYSLNFTVVPRPTLGYLTVWPTGQSQPVVSTLNALTGVVTANAAIVPSGQSGAISTYVTDNTDLIIDIDGYFALPQSGSNPLSLFILSPCRVLDTRKSSGTFSGMLPVTVLTSPCAVPSAEAYVLNATVVPQYGHPLGYLTLWPDTEKRPLVSTLNAVDGAITSNMAIVPTLNGSIDAFATNPTDLVLDIFSYYAPIGPLGITTTSLPSGTLTYNYSAPLGASGGVPPYTWSITSGSLPPGLNPPASPNWAITGTPTTAGTYPFTVQVADSQSPPATMSGPLSITVNATLTQLAVVTTSLPNGTQNTAYNAMLAATGGVTPYTWSIISGNLPLGLSLNANTGAISGTPSGGGTSNFTVQVTDTNTPPGTASAPLSITIAPAVQLSVTTTSLPPGTAGTAYSATLAAAGGVYPYTWSITNGTLPSGLQLNAITGAITGTPTTAGTSNFTVQVADSETPPATATAPLSILINPVGGGAPTYFLAGNWVGTATFVDSGQPTAYTAGASISQTGSSLTATLSVLSTDGADVYTVTGEINGNTVTFTTAKDGTQDIDATGTISQDGLQVSGSDSTGTGSGTMTWDGLQTLTATVSISDEGGEVWTGSASTDGQHLTGGATSSSGDSVSWSFTRQ